jgi:hypothetical protein
MTFCDYCKRQVRHVVHVDDGFSGQGMDKRCCFVCLYSAIQDAGENGYFEEERPEPLLPKERF